MTGRVGDLSAKQEAALKQVKEIVSDLLTPEHDDHFLLRFLRARNFDLKKTELMLRNDFAWRKQMGADTILDSYVIPEVMQKYYPGGICGQDKEGSLIWLDPCGTIDMKGILRSMRKQDILKSKIHLLESMYRRFALLTREQNRLIDQITIVFDMDHFGMKHLWKPGVDVMIELVTMFEDHYPETLKTCFVVNAPKIFPIAYNLLKPFLSEETIRKVHVVGSHYKQTLLKYIDEDQLPQHWGGTQSDPDGNPFCTSRVCMGGEVPEMYYSEDLSDLTGFTEASIGRGSSLQVDVEVAKPNCVIRWQFKTDGFDIGFGVFRKTGEGRQKAGEMEAVMASVRVNSHLIPEDGSVTCKDPGTYVMRFDNTYSWTRSKKLFYLLEVLEPDSELHVPKQNSSNNLQNNALDDDDDDGVL
ncbi:SEC14-like protein 2 [Babylonia areolata]|uniref:SEC14-like protein 2 n=1 Tax=Babylonia areolata TaxID=304850 RepID=UPI003FD65DA7